jgi:uncharacterized membrane protein
VGILRAEVPTGAALICGNLVDLENRPVVITGRICLASSVITGVPEKWLLYRFFPHQIDF